MSIHPAIFDLDQKFRNLEIHAAFGGREVQRILVACILDSQATSLDELFKELQENVLYLLPSLPPYAPPLHSINQIFLLLEEAQLNKTNLLDIKIRAGALIYKKEDTGEKQKRIAQNLLKILSSRVVVYTHTLSETVLNVLIELYRQNKIKRIIVSESRPNNDGWLTARRLAKQGVDTCLTIDAAMPAAIDETDVMISGAEMIHADGSVVGKIGARVAAVFCEKAGKPVYIVADSGKLNPTGWNDFPFTSIRLEEIGVEDAPQNLKAFGAYFDTTPASLIRSYATEKGLWTVEDIKKAAGGQKISRWLKNNLQKVSTIKKVE